MGVCIATSGPGATNLITGLADALLDSVPVVAITGQAGSAFIGTDAFQEIDVLGLSLACTKHSFLVESLDALPSIITEAFAIVTSERPGPVLIDIPKDIQLADGDLEGARRLMRQATRTILYVGGGVSMAGAVPALRQLMTETGIPAVATLKGLGAPDGDGACYFWACMATRPSIWRYRPAIC